METTRRRLLAAVLGGGALSAAAVVASLRRSSGPKPGAGFPFRAPVRTDCEGTPYWVAERLGFCAAEGLRLEWTAATQPSLLIASLLRGDIDVASFPPTQLAVAKAGGAAISAVAECEIEPTDPAVDARFRHLAWFVHPARHPEIESFADLARVPGTIRFSTWSPDLGPDLESRRLIDRFGVPRAKVDWMKMPEVQAIQALKQGLVDVSAIQSPYYRAVAEAGARRIADSSQSGLGRAAGVTYWTFADAFLQRHPREVAAWARALRGAQAWINGHASEAAKITAEAIRSPVSGIHYYSENEGVDESLAFPWIADLEENGLLPRGRITASLLVTQRIAEFNAARSDARAGAPPPRAPAAR